MTSFAASVVLALHLSLGAEPAKSPSRGGPSDEIDVSAYPPERQAEYALFRDKCSRCHSLARCAGSRLTAAQWKRHMKRPSVAVSDAQAQAILDFLRFHASRPPAR